MKAAANFVAIDLGATSGRVLVGGWDGRQFQLQELHRFANSVVRAHGHLYWDVLRLWTEVTAGLRAYSLFSASSPVSVGVDTWGVDFALLDALGNLMGTPYSYRDARTIGVPEAVFEKISELECFCQTGNQSMRINTLFQLSSMVRNRDPQLQGAATLLMLPDLFTYWLGGGKTVEYTAARTSEMLLAGSAKWADKLLEILDIPAHILPALTMPGTTVGELSEEVMQEAGFSQGPGIVRVAAHDTASAVAAIPRMDDESAFLCSGTWNLVGVETTSPFTAKEAFDLGFSNEGGVCGTQVLIRNIAGFWLLQECLRQWERRAQPYDWENLLRLADQSGAFRSFIDPDAPEFQAPHNMVEAIRLFCTKTNQLEPDSPGAFARCCIESICLRQREVLDALEALTHREIETVRMVGGGVRNHLFCQMTADASNRRVIAGPVEASATGNVALQALAARHFSNLKEARLGIAASIQQHVYEPVQNHRWDAAFDTFKRIKTRYK